MFTTYDMVVYRVTLDIDGQEDVRDYNTLHDAIEAFTKAKRKKAVFSAQIDKVTYGDDKPKRIDRFDRG